jgi:hypothetical protein
MRGLIGDRLLRRFAGRILELSEVTAPPEADSNQADGETPDSSNKRSLYTPPVHPDKTVHERRAEAEMPEQRKRG